MCVYTSRYLLVPEHPRYPHEFALDRFFCVYCGLSALEIVEHDAYICEVRMENGR